MNLKVVVVGEHKHPGYNRGHCTSEMRTKHFLFSALIHGARAWRGLVGRNRAVDQVGRGGALPLCCSECWEAGRPGRGLLSELLGRLAGIFLS